MKQQEKKILIETWKNKSKKREKRIALRKMKKL